VVVTGTSDQEEDGGVLNPNVLTSAMRLWTAIQSLSANESEGNGTNYSSLCVKFPLLPEMATALKSILASSDNGPIVNE